MAAFLKARMGPGEAGGLLIVPVPLHRAREKERGFNQSELLARHLTSALGLEPPVTALTRRAQAVSQTSLSRTERLKNIRDNFAVTGGKMVRGRTVLLIDDVLTTGATMSECARVLKQAGAKKVMGFTLASVALMP
jgi:ComF family protein